MTQRQRENIAKYLYDVSKILFAATVAGNLVAWRCFDMLSFVMGAIAGSSSLWWAYRLDGVEGKR